MTALSIRAATPADLRAILVLLDDDDQSRGREDLSEPLDPAYAAAMDAILSDPAHLLVVAEHEGEVVGTLQLTFLPGMTFHGAWRGQIENVRISSRLRGQGLGGQLIDWAVEECRRRGCRSVQLFSMTSRVDAHRFYEKLGFVKSHVGMKLAL